MGNALRLGISRIGLAWTKWRMRTKIKKKTISLLILGLQESGKTTIALRLWKYKRTLPDLSYVQTKGFNTYSIQRKNKSIINLYDLGGHSSIQELWDHYYADAHGIIFVVDTSDREKIPEAGGIFSKVLNDHRIRGKPVLLLANKQDLHGASETELDEAMNLQEVVNSVRCLTRLDESTAIDLKNGKGIFEGFRWLVSYIENHYLELNDRVIHDTLEEKNREKARRALIKEQIEHNSSPVLDRERPQSHKSNRSLRHLQIKEISAQEKELEIKIPGRVPTELEQPLIEGRNSDKTNYLIKSRPTSSHGDHYLISRKFSTAPSARGSRRSLPEIHSVRKVISFVNTEKDSLVKNSSKIDATAPISPPSISHCIVGGRLSPEGADSDEGIVNSAFDYSLEESPTRKNTFAIPTSLSPIVMDRVRNLVRSESSDTERHGEIMMVTTLVQVHEASKDRRVSTTSTHDSVAISVSSFKSEEIDGWKESQDETLSGQQQPTLHQLHSLQYPSVLNQSKGNEYEENSSKFPNLEKEKAKRKYNFKLARNKTGPMPAGMDISTIQSSYESPNRSLTSLNRFSIPNGRTVRQNSAAASGTSLERVGSGNGAKSNGKSRLKKKSLSGFSDPLESNSQFVSAETTSTEIEQFKKY